MLVMAGLSVAAAIITALFVAHGRITTDRLAAADSRYSGCAVARIRLHMRKKEIIGDHSGNAHTAGSRHPCRPDRRRLSAAAPGIGLETARQARTAGAASHPHRSQPRAARSGGRDRGRGVSAATLDLGDPTATERFFAGLPAGRSTTCLSPAEARSTYRSPTWTSTRRCACFDEHLLGSLRIARASAQRVRPGGSLTLITGTDARRPGVGSSIAAISCGRDARHRCEHRGRTGSDASERDRGRVRRHAVVGADLGDEPTCRRAELRATLPIGRVVATVDVAAIAVHLMTNTAVTGATFDVDGGQQLIP